MLNPHILLRFTTNMGRMRILRVNNPDTGVMDSVVNTSMDNIIDSNAVRGTNGSLTEKRSASLISYEVKPINLPA
jgi:hypothetical protein